jgi:hypothetical protein
MLLIHKNHRLFTNNDTQIYRNQNQIKIKPKISIQDNVLQMNMKNTNSNCL